MYDRKIKTVHKTKEKFIYKIIKVGDEIIRSQYNKFFRVYKGLTEKAKSNYELR